MKTIKKTYYLTLSRNNSMPKIRKQSYKLEDDEVGFKLDIVLPYSFWNPKKKYMEKILEIKELPEEKTTIEVNSLVSDK